MRKLTRCLRWIPALFLLAASPALADVIVRPVGTAPNFYDLSKLTPEEAAVNRYGRRIPLVRLNIEVYLSLSGVADTNLRPEVLACIGLMGNQIPSGPDDPLLAGQPTCAIYDYSRYRWFDYGDTTPDANSFGLSKSGMLDPVIGTLMDASLSPAGVLWEDPLASGLHLTGSNQFDPNNSNALSNPAAFRSAVVYQMHNQDGVAHLQIFIPSIISSLYTGKNTAFGLPPSVIELGYTNETERLLRPGEALEGSPVYQTPMCANIVDRIPYVTWSSYSNIDFNPRFDLDSTSLNPPYPGILRATVAVRFASQAPPPELQRDVSILSYDAPALSVVPSAVFPDDMILVPVGAVRLFEERANYLYPVILSDSTHAPFYPLLSIIPKDPGVVFAGNLMSRSTNLFVTDDSPNAAFGPGANIVLSQGPNAWTAEVQSRVDANTGEMRFQAGLVRVPRSRVIEAVTTNDPARRCLNFILRLDDYCEECKTIQRIETEAPLVCFNPATADR